MVALERGAKREKKLFKFEFVVMALSAALAAFGVSAYLQGDLAVAFLAVGVSIKMITGLGRVPVIDLERLMNASSAEELEEQLERQRAKNDQEKPYLRWFSEFSTYLILGGFFLILLEMF